jgi:hypothetical protein
MVGHKKASVFTSCRHKFACKVGNLGVRIGGAWRLRGSELMGT